MGKNTKTKKEGLYYSKESFFNDLLSCHEYAEGHSEQERLGRDYIYKLKVLQAILYLDVPDLVLDGEKPGEDIGKKQMEMIIDGDELLFGYTFYVSSHSEFERTWSYMRKQLDKYTDFLFETKRFFDFVFRNINVLAFILEKYKNIHIVFNGFVDVAYQDRVSNLKVKMLWDKFYNIIDVGKVYTVSVMIGDSTLIVYDCKYRDEAEKLVEKVKAAISGFEFK